jgi:hypothetical protein
VAITLRRRGPTEMEYRGYCHGGPKYGHFEQCRVPWLQVPLISPEPVRAKWPPDDYPIIAEVRVGEYVWSGNHWQYRGERN